MPRPQAQANPGRGEGGSTVSSSRGPGSVGADTGEDVELLGMPPQRVRASARQAQGREALDPGSGLPSHFGPSK